MDEQRDRPARWTVPTRAGRVACTRGPTEGRSIRGRIPDAPTLDAAAFCCSAGSVAGDTRRRAEGELAEILDPRHRLGRRHFFIYGQVWATLAGDTIGVPISTQQTQGPNQNIILVDSKQVELGMTTMGIALQAWKGEGAWTQGKKFQNIRALFPMYDTPFHFITTDKTGIKSVKDLNGRSVGVGPRAGTPGTYFPLMFEALGVKPSAIRYGGASDMGAARRRAARRIPVRGGAADLGIFGNRGAAPSCSSRSRRTRSRRSPRNSRNSRKRKSRREPTRAEGRISRRSACSTSPSRTRTCRTTSLMRSSRRDGEQRAR